jgi:hypothetical protein
MIPIAPTASRCDVCVRIRVSAPEHRPNPFRRVLRHRIDALQVPQFRVLFDFDSIRLNCRRVLLDPGFVFS